LSDLLDVLTWVKPCKSFVIYELWIIILGSLILLLFIFVGMERRKTTDTALSVKREHIRCELGRTNLWKNICIIESSHVIVSSHSGICCNWSLMRLLLFNRFTELIEHACSRLGAWRTWVKLPS
jgi:hypothetical protein